MSESENPAGKMSEDEGPARGRCKPGPRDGGGGPQTIPFVKRECTKRENAQRESCLIIILKEERRYTRITLGFRSQGVEQFVRGDRGMFDVFVVHDTESEGGHPPFYALLLTTPLVGVFLRARPEA